jgi:hypothetical protein
MRGMKLCNEAVCPILKYFNNGDVICDRESQIEIRPTVAFIERKRTDDGPGNNPRIGSCHLEHTVADAITITNSKHVDASSC